MPCDCGPPLTEDELLEIKKLENERNAIMESNYARWSEEVPKLRALVKFYQGFIPDKKMEYELEALRKIIKKAKAGADVTTMIIPEETKEYKLNES